MIFTNEHKIFKVPLSSRHVEPIGTSPSEKLPFADRPEMFTVYPPEPYSLESEYDITEQIGFTVQMG